MKDPSVATTKGAPKKGKEVASERSGVRVSKRKCRCCGEPGHTKRTFSRQDIEDGSEFGPADSVQAGDRACFGIKGGNYSFLGNSSHTRRHPFVSLRK
ncbi:hypothetical protein PIB30_059594 [Stylosanthes scabra]|uniref:CCHC-type domain-containing protein n=1 Tax=Stylosanthes scabra TaxID=79078 RepID=A0ABU6WK71_9FABA|nr:hypothetical protein [Stylosanthes scabra]